MQQLPQQMQRAQPPPHIQPIPRPQRPQQSQQSPFTQHPQHHPPYPQQQHNAPVVPSMIVSRNARGTLTSTVLIGNVSASCSCSSSSCVDACTNCTPATFFAAYGSNFRYYLETAICNVASSIYTHFSHGHAAQISAEQSVHSVGYAKPYLACFSYSDSLCSSCRFCSASFPGTCSWAVETIPS